MVDIFMHSSLIAQAQTETIPSQQTKLPEVDNEFVFYTTGGDRALTPKGIALKIDDFTTRKAIGQKIFLAQGIKTLVNALKLFVDSQETKLILCFDTQDSFVECSNCSHRLFFICQRYKGKMYFVAMDSLGLIHSFAQDCFDEFADRFPKLKDEVVFGINETVQQTRDELCTTYMIKNVQKVALNPDFLKDIIDNHVIKESTKHTFQYFIYRLPPTHMSIAKSWDTLEKYIGDQKELSTKIIRTDKQGRKETLLQYALHERKKHNTVTPITIKNYHYKPPKFVNSSDRNTSIDPRDEKAQPEFVYKNNSNYNG